MKKIAVLLLSTLLLATACKDNGKKDTKNKETEATAKATDPNAAFDLQLYRRSLERGDAYTAIAALSSYLLRDSSQEKYRDTLLQLYLQTQQMMATFRTSSEVLKYRPNDTAILQLNVAAAYELGAMDMAVDNTKKLIEIDPNNLALKFQYGQSLLQLGKTAEGISIIEGIISNPRANGTKVPYTAFENGRQVQKELKLNLAALMIMGQYYAQGNDYDKSESYFRQALKINPQFKEAAQAVLDLKALRRGEKP